MRQLFFLGFVAIAFGLPDDEHHHLKLGGACEELRVELEGSATAEAKLERFNSFLNSLGSNIQSEFYAIVEESKTAITADTNLSDEAKNQAIGIINDFSTGSLFKSHVELSDDIHQRLSQLSEEDKKTLNKLSKQFAKKFKKLLLPQLPSNCRASSPALDDVSSASQGFDNNQYQPKKKRQAMFLDNVISAYRHFNRIRRSME